MLRWLLSICLLGVALASVQHMEVNYSFGDDTVTMDVTVDADNNIIHYYIPEDEYFEEVETIDDFYAGYSAVKVKTDEACYVQPLDTTLEERVYLIKNNPEQIIEGSINSTSVLLSDDELEDLSDRVVDFCDGYPIYEVFFESTRDDSSEEDSSEESQDSSDESQNSSDESQDSSDESQDSSDESQDSSDESQDSEEEDEEVFTRSPGHRQVAVTFRKCVILFFIQKCCETTLTIPTGSSITFLWLFGVSRRPFEYFLVLLLRPEHICLHTSGTTTTTTTTMLRWLLSICLLGVTLASVQHMEVNYSFGDDTVTMDVTVDADNNIIHYYIPEDEYFEEVETIDDFYAGYSAVKVKTDEACYVQPLDTTLEERVYLIKNNPEQIIEGSINSTSVLLSDDELEDLSDRVVDFCDGYPIYEVFFESTRDDFSEEGSNENLKIPTMKVPVKKLRIPVMNLISARETLRSLGCRQVTVKFP
ncbi:uncharacterized protein LOC123508477 [Portunus trituberculatus]|uniref:uncharacterized protein LOC123508477 n=1 Tax=Portunus trituberculatus TaxID=210409 RepID=UPI001E1D040D|nr:uncharacterized protein LOC123508477 [Portunus trituberculatus]